MQKSQPTRGDGGAYQRYLEGMDASMRQKVALTAAHLLFQGRVADMGMGSGTGSYWLAALYPSLEVVGVDLDPEMVRLAGERYRLPNLSFIVGDIAEPCFPQRHLDGMLVSSTLHHVTTFGGYDHRAATRAIAVESTQLAPHGVLIIRDFVAPGLDRVWLDLPTDDGDDSDDPRSCSTARLFERFATEFRHDIEAPREPGFAYSMLDVAACDCATRGGEPPFSCSCTTTTLKRGCRRYELSLRHAVEFVLRKNYRRDWAKEVLEEYTYFDQPEFESLFAELGMRVLASTPIRNPWIVQNRFVDRFELRRSDGTPLDWPATNYVIVGERVPADEGVRFSFEPAERVGFLQLSCYLDTVSGRTLDLVRRPGLTIDALPWFELAGDLFVLARRSYPRPMLAVAREQTQPVDGCLSAEYVTEPLVVVQQDKPLAQTVEEFLRVEAQIPESSIRRFEPGDHYYPSPGGIQEEVRSLFVEIEPAFVQQRISSRSGFSTSGVIRAIETRQLLRAAQVGGLPDARLELNVYELLARRGLDPGPWIGETIELTEQSVDWAPSSLDELLARPERRRFRSASTEGSCGFLGLESYRFSEHNADGEVLHSQILECVVPTKRSAVTVVIAPLCRIADGVVIGLDDDDLPAAQCFTGNSQLLVAPAWRLPTGINTMWQARQFIAERLSVEYALEARRIFALGGRYHPSPGATPEVALPFCVEVGPGSTTGERALSWTRLEQLAQNMLPIRDGHLSIVARRAAHALGLLTGNS